jgi:hypothetical protein
LSLLPSAAAQRNKDNYEADLEWIVKNLYSRFTSAQVILDIALHGDKNVVIRPRAIPDPSPAEDDFSRFYNATTTPSNVQDALPAGETTSTNKEEPWKDLITGTGQGSDALIEFNPGVYQDAMGVEPKDPSDHAFWVRQGRSDCVLLHELVHAMSDVSGVDARTKSAPAGYNNLEEFTAVVITNVYAAETSGGTPPLLSGRHDGRALPLLLRGSRPFYERYRTQMQDVCDNHRRLARQLKLATGISHNPFVYCT